MWEHPRTTGFRAGFFPFDLCKFVTPEQLGESKTSNLSLHGKIVLGDRYRIMIDCWESDRCPSCLGMS
jgi:hypothetical protein